MEDLQKLRKLYHLKNVERANTVKDRKESSAEHSWSCLILADYFLTKMQNHHLDRLKVYELLASLPESGVTRPDMIGLSGNDVWHPAVASADQVLLSSTAFNFTAYHSVSFI